MPHWLDTGIEYLKGVGPQRAEALKKELGIHTLGDLLSHYPFRHEDRSQVYRINSLQGDDVWVQLQGTIRPIGMTGQGNGRRYVAMLHDGSGEIELVWFKGIVYVDRMLKPGTTYRVYGKINNFKGKLSIAHPELDALIPNAPIKPLSLVPVYPLTEGMRRKKLENKFLVTAAQNAVNSTLYDIPENLPQAILNKYKFISRKDAVKELHFPQNLARLEEAKRRLKFEELFYLQLRHLMLKGFRNRTYKGLVFDKVGTYFHDFYDNHLPFELTGAQKRVLKEIRNDFKTGQQCNRLIQGDVGSGKTMVAMLSMLIAIDNGYQACMMAPTEILANQHFDGLRDWVETLGLRMELLTGSTTKKKREQLLIDLADGQIHILVGTHALIEQDVQYKQLGLVVIDEQHRFGVAQRAKLWKKGHVLPHILVMTATPIPRTLAMTVYGDLDVSVIDEMPAGRKPIVTVHRQESMRPAIMEFLRNEIAKGRQIYYVFPLIEDSEKLDLNSLMSGYDMVSTYLPPPQFKYSIVHGKLKAAEKDASMNLFKNHQTDILIATTVIEVGVNVPNASVMVIENAERFGLAQLHQLRGRVGRGNEQSYCVLITKPGLGENGYKRISTMVNTNDGFEIAKVDLELRGPGELDGTKQSGVLELKLADIRYDESTLIASRVEAQQWLESDELLMKPESAPIKAELAKIPNRTVWSKIS
ncbi:MAG: ATP-dependent DNA helicase RecG [Bacteroidetes bacterium]|jgi:ATP-dependent DNA helicase RecG|nr:ATP-dependent DNA helicase RecG [Bacteroidota bacterium]